MQQDEKLKKEEDTAAEQEMEKETEEISEENDEAASEETGGEDIPDAKDQEIADLKNRLLRLQADFENFRRRSQQEKTQLSAFVTAGVVSKFLKVLDNFERAEESAAKTADPESLLTGMKQIRKQFAEVFKELGVEEIEAMNKKFDPNLHEAVLRGENPELEDETIDMVLEKGYKLHDKVIRHSKVRVISHE
ncbi:MAG: nucleotide exchange factor GrpE [Phascolarctobacterium sp.]|nr:nucleotide exchange factor GrpE [Phascolarctobacterium sp.]